MKNIILTFILFTAFMTGIMNSPIKSTAYTQQEGKRAEITYPISLSTGLDAAGRLIFPDKEFLSYIAAESFQSGLYRGMRFDLDQDGTLSQEECELVRILRINGRKDILSIEGIGAFPKLRELYCANTGITILDVSYNSRLQVLSAYNNAIKSLDTSECPLLKSLDVHSASITSLDLSKNLLLEFLNLDNQSRNTGEYQSAGRFIVNLYDLDTKLDIAKISQVKIDGAQGDGIHSTYHKDEGMVSCSDEMQTINYCYDTGNRSQMEVCLHISPAYREAYETNGGTKVLSQYVKLGDKDSEPEQPKKDGYCFTGWYTKKDGNVMTQWNFNETLSGNITLYAGWKKKCYQVNFDAMGATFGVPETVKDVDWWTTNFVPRQKPIKKGYTFLGWQTENGQLLTEENMSSLTYGQASGDSDKDEMMLTAVWEAKKGYRLSFSTELNVSQQEMVNNMPQDNRDGTITWTSKEFLDWNCEPELAGYNFLGWFTERNGGSKVTPETRYGDIYAQQYTDDSVGNIPTLYARFQKKKITIYYDTRGGSQVDNRSDVEWGSKNLLPLQKTKKKNYIFAGWKCAGKKVKKTTTTDEISDGFEDTITLTAVWYKKYEKKGTTFKRYGCRYKIIQSNKKGQRVRLIGVTRKKVTIRNKIFYNGKMFTLSGIKHKILKGAKVKLKVPAKQKKRYTKLIKSAGAKKTF